MNRILSDPNNRMSYDESEIKQLLVEGDIAIVRLVWSLHSDGKLIKENGLDILKRQADGSWKITISYAYPIDK